MYVNVINVTAVFTLLVQIKIFLGAWQHCYVWYVMVYVEVSSKYQCVMSTVNLLGWFLREIKETQLVNFYLWLCTFSSAMSGLIA